MSSSRNEPIPALDTGTPPLDLVRSLQASGGVLTAAQLHGWRDADALLRTARASAQQLLRDAEQDIAQQRQQTETLWRGRVEAWERMAQEQLLRERDGLRAGLIVERVRCVAALHDTWLRTLRLTVERLVGGPLQAEALEALLQAGHAALGDLAGASMRCHPDELRALTAAAARAFAPLVLAVRPDLDLTPGQVVLESADADVLLDLNDALTRVLGDAPAAADTASQTAFRVPS